jgi:hypothetical protein
MGALELLARCRVLAKQYDKAIDAYRGEFFLGWHMMNERSCVPMLLKGLAYQRRALVGMEDVYRRSGDADDRRDRAILQYQADVGKVSSHVRAKVDGMWSTRHPTGDILYIAAHDADRACRVEATLQLGVVKWVDAGREPNAELIAKAIAEKLAAGDPLEAAAARAADAFTRQQWDELR